MITIHPTAIVVDSTLGEGTVVWAFCNIYKSRIGKRCTIAGHVELGGVTVGNDCKIEFGAFLPNGVTLGRRVFIGPHVCFTNDKYPRANAKHFQVLPTVVEDGASIGANSTVRCGVCIGHDAMIGAGAVVTEDVRPNAVVYGEKATQRRLI